MESSEPVKRVRVACEFSQARWNLRETVARLEARAESLPDWASAFDRNLAATCSRHDAHVDFSIEGFEHSLSMRSVHIA